MRATLYICYRCCSKPKATLPSDFIGVTKVEVIDYLKIKVINLNF